MTMTAAVIVISSSHRQKVGRFTLHSGPIIALFGTTKAERGIGNGFQPRDLDFVATVFANAVSASRMFVKRIFDLAQAIFHPDNIGMIYGLIVNHRRVIGLMVGIARATLFEGACHFKLVQFFLICSSQIDQNIVESFF
jgi:hypothetical protein